MTEDKAQSPNLRESVLRQMYLAATCKERAKQFADTARTAEITGLSRRTILVWIETGKLEAVRIGNKHQVSLKSLHDYLTRLSDT